MKNTKSHDAIFKIVQGDDPKMDDANVARLAEILERVFDEEDVVLTPELSAKDVEGCYSMTHIRLIPTIKRTFNNQFSTSEIGKLDNVGDLVALMKGRI